ncbi:hypothetical protein ACPPVU_23015 [Mucilaginibacter sp. McL0603]|uniref:hypothetical protein n=1 Tax=Mucilaginibacter sp. McL0603 TaxID=3415670 RepID=UPI003CFB09FD
MKKILITIIAMGVMLAFSCKKDNPVHQAFIGANFNNANWIADPTTQFLNNSRDTLLVKGFHAGGEQNITFKVKFRGVGTYTLKANEGSFYTTMGSDVVTSQYKLDTTKMNNVHFDQYNAATGVSAGGFELHFIRTSATGSLGTTLDFTNGQFWMQIP